MSQRRWSHPPRQSPHPVIGWRLWRLEAGRLGSWALDYVWQPGENRARCLALRQPACLPVPGTHCQCGFWALWSPLHCLSKARNTCIDRPWHVLGLIAGWGTVALHGREGFRAEHASVLCLFTDWAGSTPVLRLTESRLINWWRNTWHGVGEADPPAWPDPGSERTAVLESAATYYGVPLVSLKGALHLGVLGELGVARDQILEVEALVAASTARPGRD